MKEWPTFFIRVLCPLIMFLIIQHPSGVSAADDMAGLLPPVSCGAGWRPEGKPSLYDRETLSDRINGESELYFPYGFDRMAANRYASEKQSGAGIDVEIYRMGSLLDAFGMFANYRQKEGRELQLGAGSNLAGSQLFFYQGRYFVHIQVTGADTVDPDTLSECGKTVAARLPGGRNRPAELALFEKPEIIKGSERYLPQSLLGYDFLNKGLMTDAVIEGKELQVFRLLGTTAASAGSVFERYRAQLGQGTVDAGEKSMALLEGNDPLYGQVMILKQGACLAGALKFSAKKGVRALLDGLCK